MKKIQILAIVIISLLFTNCSDSKEDSIPPYLYTFHLKFVDADNNNNNLLEDMDLSLLMNSFSLASASEKDAE